jgi:hypothetical protein
MTEHHVIEVRATGRTPEVVRGEIQTILTTQEQQGWELLQVQPIIYNSSTTGYLLLFFTRRTGGPPAVTDG